MSGVDGAAGPGGGTDPDAADTTTVVDARGLRCPIPVIRLARQAQPLTGGDLITVWTTDPAAEHDVPAWARMRGHAIEKSIDVDAADGPFRAITVRIGG